MEESDVIRKVQKALELADPKNGATKEIAEVAMLTAQKLMIENDISMSDITPADVKPKEIVDEVIKSSGRLTWWQESLSVIIADNFKCYIYKRRNRTDGITNINFLGLKSDVEIAREVYLYAVDVIYLKYKEYMTKIADDGASSERKNQYLFGFLDGLKDKFAEQVKHNDWALVIVKDPEVTKAFDQLKPKKGKKKNIYVNFNETDKINGYRDGKNFQFVAGKLT